MDDKTVIFEGQCTHLRAVAYRLLGWVHEADDAVQEAWLRLERSDVSEVDNLSAWLTTVVSRICPNQLRSRASRREDLGVEPDEAVDRVPDPAVVMLAALSAAPSGRPHAV
jgi:DNA-directed RNA polymerase specialized sigma24 family protein